MVTGLIHGHSGLAYLVMATANLSLLFALVYTARPSGGLLKAATVVSRRIEPALMGVVGLLGIGAWVAAGFPVTTWYLWIGVVVWIGHGVWAGKANKPTLVALSEGRSPQLHWVVVALVNAVLVNGVFGLMQSY
jgi:hypothetical protein